MTLDLVKTAGCLHDALPAMRGQWRDRSAALNVAQERLADADPRDVEARREQGKSTWLAARVENGLSGAFPPPPLPSLLNRHMVKQALTAVQETDMVLFLVDARRGILAGDEQIAARLAALSTPVIGVLNKIDLLPRSALLPVLERLAGLLPGRELVPVSALRSTNTTELLSTLIQPLPVGPALYPSDELTDQSERLFAQEMIREQIFFHAQQEVPYATAAVVEEFTEKADLLVIRAAIHVERTSQKAIVIGKGGTRLKTIGQAARRRMEAFFGRKVFLELFVKVSTGWTNRPAMW